MPRRKEITEAKIFKGNQVQVNQAITDIQYVPYKYFLVTKDPNPEALPQNNSEQIWVDPGNGLQPPQGNPNFLGPFQKFLPGRDYTIDYTTGTVTFLTPVGVNSRIAVAYQRRDGGFVGEDSSKTIYDLGTSGTNTSNPNLTVPPNGLMQPGPNQPHLMKNNANSADVSPLYLLNYYSLGTVAISSAKSGPQLSIPDHQPGDQ